MVSLRVGDVEKDCFDVVVVVGRAGGEGGRDGEVGRERKGELKESTDLYLLVLCQQRPWKEVPVNLPSRQILTNTSFITTLQLFFSFKKNYLKNTHPVLRYSPNQHGGPFLRRGRLWRRGGGILKHTGNPTCLAFYQNQALTTRPG